MRVNCHTGDSLGRQQVEADSNEQVLKALGESATKMREKLGESLASVQKYDAPVEQATTSSLAALQAYSQGIKAKFTQGDEGRSPALQASHRTRSQLRHGICPDGNNLRKLETEFGMAADDAKKAYELRQRVTERERFFIDSLYCDVVTRDLEDSIACSSPGSRPIPRTRSRHAVWRAQYSNLGQLEKALAEYQESLRLDPSDATNYGNVGFAFVNLNRFDEGRQVWSRLRPGILPASFSDPELFVGVCSRGQQPQWIGHWPPGRARHGIGSIVLTGSNPTPGPPPAIRESAGANRAS